MAPFSARSTDCLRSSLPLKKRKNIVGIVIGSTMKGLVVGVLVGWYATRVQSLAKGLVVGLIVAAIFAFLIAAMPNEQGGHYWFEIMIPGCIVGLIVGYATQRFGAAPAVRRTSAATSR